MTRPLLAAAGAMAGAILLGVALAVIVRGAQMALGAVL